MGKRLNLIVTTVLGIAIGVACIYALTFAFESVSVASILSSAQKVAGERLLLAGILVLACYALLGVYDRIALETIGKPLPWRVVFTGSTSAYALSHNLGLAPITASGARWRIYRPHGLDLPDIARIVLITGMSFWLGIILVMGIGLAVFPDLIANSLPSFIPRGSSQAIGIAIIAFNLGYLIAIKGGWKTLGWRKASVPLPSIKNASMQTVIGGIEMLLVSGVLWCLIPGAGIELLPALFLAYVVAFVSVLITHAPGGIGVLELVIITMLPDVPPTDLLAGLLLFRVVFHLIPLVVAVGLLTFAPLKVRALIDPTLPQIPDPLNTDTCVKASS